MPLTLPTIYTSGLKLLSKQSSKVMSELVIKEAMKVVRGVCGILQLNEHGKLVMVYATFKNAYGIVPRKNGFSYTTYLSQKPQVVPKDVVATIHPTLHFDKGKNWIYIPLAYEATSFGVINVLSELDEAYIKHHIDELLVFGTMITLAIKNAVAMRKMEQAIRTRDIFISLTHHELKTPLTTIMAYAHLAHKAVQKGEVPQLKWVEQILNEAQRQKRIIDELYTVDQINAGTFNYNLVPRDVVELVTDIVKDAQVRNPQRTIEVIIDPRILNNRPVVEVDADKLHQALGNILNNALRYSEKEIIIRLIQQNESTAIKVEDYGKGISKRDLPNIFTIFRRGKHEKKAGLGIGLYLTKQIIEAHQGTIEVESKLHRGTTFTIQLPTIQNRSSIPEP